jgi:hypothetical protein
MNTSKTLKTSFMKKIILASLLISTSFSTLLAQNVSTVATGLGSSLGGIVVDSIGNIYVSVRSADQIKKIDPQGNVTIYCNSGLNDPVGLAFDTQGNLYVANFGGNFGTTVSKIPSGGGPATNYITGISAPFALEQYDGDTLIVQEYFDKKVYKVHPGGGVASSPSVPLLATPPGGTRGGGIGVLPNKDLIICTFGSFYSYKLDISTNTLTQLSGPLSYAQLDISNGVGTDFYFGDYNLYKVYKLDGTTGSVTAYAGTGTPGGADGPIATAQFNIPYFLWSDPFGTIYLTESGTGKVRKISGQSSVSNLTMNGNNNLCAGDSILLTASYQTNFYASSTYTHSWSGPNGFTSNSLTVSIPNANNSHSGYYVFTVTDINGIINQDSVLITVNALPNVSANATSTSVCQGSQVTLTGSGAASYTWDNGVTDGVPFTPTATTTYAVIGTDANGCSNTDQVTVTVNALPNVSANASATSVCAGGQVTLTGSGATTYTWTGGVTNGVAFTPTNTATYTLTGTDANGCSNTDQVTVTVNALPTVSANASATSVCAGGQVTLTGSGATTYTWTGGVINGVAFTPANTATYTLTGTDANGCSNTVQVTVTVNPLPDVTVSNNSNTLTANQSGATYQWIDCNNNNAPISGATNKSYTPATSGSYAVIVTLNGCSDTSACQTVTITGLDTQASSKLPFSIYPNPNQGTFTIQSTKGGVFELIDVTGKVINTYAITNTQQTVHENLPAGMYFVREKVSGGVQKLIIE